MLNFSNKKTKLNNYFNNFIKQNNPQFKDDLNDFYEISFNSIRNQKTLNY